MTAPLVQPASWDPLLAAAKADQLNRAAGVVAALEGMPIQLLALSSVAAGGPIWYPCGAGQFLLRTNQSFGVNTIVAAPFICSVPFSCDQIGFNVSGAGGAGSVTRCAVYAAGSLATAYYPTSLIAQVAADIDTSTTGDKTAALAVSFTPGLYWFTVNSGTAAPGIFTVTSGNSNLGIFGSSTPSVGQRNCLTLTQTYGAFPAVFPVGAAWQAVLPILSVRLAG